MFGRMLDKVGSCARYFRFFQMIILMCCPSHRMLTLTLFNVNFVFSNRYCRYSVFNRVTDAECCQDMKDPWKDLSAIIMEEKYKAEERREIIGEEWRKISRILDRFLLIIFSLASLITTVWCIFVSPHYPNADTDSRTSSPV